LKLLIHTYDHPPIIFNFLPIAPEITVSRQLRKAATGMDGVKRQIQRGKGYRKTASSGFLMTGHTVTHKSRSSNPPMSNRVDALNSFVLLAR